jgi:hypothetical protein
MTEIEIDLKIISMIPMECGAKQKYATYTQVHPSPPIHHQSIKHHQSSSSKNAFLSFYVLHLNTTVYIAPTSQYLDTPIALLSINKYKYKKNGMAFLPFLSLNSLRRWKWSN